MIVSTSLVRLLCVCIYALVYMCVCVCFCAKIRSFVCFLHSYHTIYICYFLSNSLCLSLTTCTPPSPLASPCPSFSLSVFITTSIFLHHKFVKLTFLNLFCNLGSYIYVYAYVHTCILFLPLPLSVCT